MIEAREPATRAFFARTNCFPSYSTVTLFARFRG
jgi:hypothetical protein